MTTSRACLTRGTFCQKEMKAIPWHKYGNHKECTVVAVSTSAQQVISWHRIIVALAEPYIQPLLLVLAAATLFNSDSNTNCCH
jgi:hypothetical protein